MTLEHHMKYTQAEPCRISYPAHEYLHPPRRQQVRLSHGLYRTALFLT
jgi:hypothetical protein